MSTRPRTAWLRGGEFACPQPPPPVARAWRIVLLGPPGVGKGVQADLLGHALGACWLSTGDLFRAAREKSGAVRPALAAARAHLARGELVPDTVVLPLLRERRRCLACRGGFLLDGFPRTLVQARALDALLAVAHVRLDAVIAYEADEQVLRAHLAGRRVCRRCQAVYHLASRPPRIPGVCDDCGGALHQRPDDHPDAFVQRLHDYARATRPLIEYYREEDLLVSVNAEGPPGEILARTLDALASVCGGADARPLGTDLNAAGSPGPR